MISFLKFWAGILALLGVLKMVCFNPRKWGKPEIEVYCGGIIVYDPVSIFLQGLVFFVLGVSFIYFV